MERRRSASAARLLGLRGGGGSMTVTAGMTVIFFEEGCTSGVRLPRLPQILIVVPAFSAAAGVASAGSEKDGDDEAAD